ncbi:dnaJ homolog subfamily C member 4 isoform X2 [Eublepharis macularius]|uniref:DnaJ homolog subfamily C member 4 isoform X2 n=1 Tax=Eublepharis macularius TaxID=481883 RepID=A0AA97K961_EUBMA|nr:dnaJ homolog subfamily C member 4 isoform X2 [Eublepharis macularius]
MTSAIPYLICRCYQQCQSARHRAFSTTLCSWSPTRNSNYYDLLGIKQDATLEEVKQAFFRKSKKLHPDSDPSNPDLHSQFVKLHEAYKVLSKESSRRCYDRLRTAQGPQSSSGSYHSSPKRQPFDFGSFGARRESDPNENVRYWQQFHKPPVESFSGPELEEKQRLNRRLFGYCLLMMLGSLLVHYVGYRKLEEAHNHFMDEKDRVITQIYNENKERARSISLQEQQELLRQKRAEFAQRYGIRHGQLPRTTGASDSVKDPPAPSSTAK